MRCNRSRVQQHTPSRINPLEKYISARPVRCFGISRERMATYRLPVTSASVWLRERQCIAETLKGVDRQYHASAQLDTWGPQEPHAGPERWQNHWPLLTSHHITYAHHITNSCTLPTIRCPGTRRFSQQPTSLKV